MAIFNRFPRAGQVAAVYAVITLVVYSWTLLWFFWEYPSWLYFLNIGEILSILAYSLANNFAESLAVLAVPVVLAVVLPGKRFREAFVARSLALVLPILGYMMYVARQFDEKLDYPSAALDLAPLVLAGALLLVFVVGRVGFVRKTLEAFADRAVVFNYLSIPVSVLAVVLVGIRVLF